MGERILIVLDTHIFLWLTLQPERIPSGMLTAISNEKTLGIPAISMWEIAMLAGKKRITLPRPVLEWLHEALSFDRFAVLPLSPEIAARSGELPMHGDPADRLIAATAIEYDCPLATADDLLLQLPMLKFSQ
jgi:PIN domain nuclease of toxin-antitoxin system